MMPPFVTVIAEWCVVLSGLACVVLAAVWLSLKAIDKVSDWLQIHEALCQFIFQRVREKIQRKSR